MVCPRRRFPILSWERLVVVVLGRQAVPAPLAKPPEGCGIARILDVGDVETAITPRQPRIAELVVDNGQRLVPEARIDGLRPHLPRLVQVLIGIDHGSHSSPPGETVARGSVAVRVKWISARLDP